MSINSRFLSCLRIPTLLFILLLIGCESKGVRLDGFVPDNGGSPSLTTGDGGTCNDTVTTCTNTNGLDWNDSFITPNSFTVALKSAMLIKMGETTPSYTIFDSGDPAKPVIQSFSLGTTQTFATNTDFPTDGTYDRIQYVVSYYEMVIPINSQDRRVRLYLGSISNDPSLGQQVLQKDILIEDPSDNRLKWINPSTGLGLEPGAFISSRNQTTSVLQVPNRDPNRPAEQLELNGLLGSIDTSTGTFTDGVTPAAPLPYLIARLSTALTAPETTTLTINYLDQNGNSSTTPPFTINDTTPINTDILVPLEAGDTRIKDITLITRSPATTTVATVQFFGIGGVDTPVTDPYTFTFPLSAPLTISGSPDKQFVIQLTFNTSAIFFFDDTFQRSSTQISNTNFNPPLRQCETQFPGGPTTEPCDGRLDAVPKANFWPGLPAVTTELK